MVAEHARSLVFVDYGDLQAPGLLAKAFYFLTGFGHEAVMVFFVISGFLVGGKVWSLYQEGRFEWRRYLVDRVSRLYAVLFVALLLGAILDWVGYLYFNKYGLYSHGYQGAIAVFRTAPIDQMGWEYFLVNGLFLQTILGPTYGSNGPLWSLAYEWWYYILFPLVLAAVWPIVDYGKRFLKGDRRSKIGDGGNEEILTMENTKRTEGWAGARLASQDGDVFSNPSTSELARDSEKTSLTRSTSGPVLPVTNYSLIAKHAFGALVYLLAIAGLFCLLTWNILIFFGVWLLGVLAAVFGPKIFGSQSPVLRLWISFAALIVCGGIFCVERLEILEKGMINQYLIGFGFFLLLISLSAIPWNLPCYRFSKHFADFSYSVYLVHFPVLVFTLSLAYQFIGSGIRMPFHLGAFLWYLSVFMLSILVSWIISLFTEKKTPILRAFIYQVFKIEVKP